MVWDNGILGTSGIAFSQSRVIPSEVRGGKADHVGADGIAMYIEVFSFKI